MKPFLALVAACAFAPACYGYFSEGQTAPKQVQVIHQKAHSLAELCMELQRYTNNQGAAQEEQYSINEQIEQWGKIEQYDEPYYKDIGKRHYYDISFAKHARLVIVVDKKTVLDHRYFGILYEDAQVRGMYGPEDFSVIGIYMEMQIPDTNLVVSDIGADGIRKTSPVLESWLAPMQEIICYETRAGITCITAESPIIQRMQWNEKYLQALSFLEWELKKELEKLKK